MFLLIVFGALIISIGIVVHLERSVMPRQTRTMYWGRRLRAFFSVLSIVFFLVLAIYGIIELLIAIFS